jgi:dTDP-4-amino-4,6-dideoxygalactose transaminase
LGFRYHLANLHAAIGLAQLDKFETIRSSRQALFSEYASALSGIDGLRTPTGDFSSITPFMFYLRVEDGRRDDFRDALQAAGVDTGIHWQPAHWFTLFKDARRGPLDVTERVGKEIVTIPFHSAMAPERRDRVIKNVLDFFAPRAVARAM